jgi:hypothetical protein
MPGVLSARQLMALAMAKIFETATMTLSAILAKDALPIRNGYCSGREWRIYVLFDHTLLSIFKGMDATRITLVKFTI